MSPEGTRVIGVRMPNDLADELKQLAADQGVSLNQLIVALLAGATGWQLKKRG